MVSLWKLFILSIPAGARKSTFTLTPQRGGGVKVLLRYFLTEKVTKRLQ